MKCNQSRSGFELVSPCPFPTTITITPRALHKWHIYPSGVMTCLEDRKLLTLYGLEIMYTVIQFRLFFSNTNNFQTGLFNPYHKIQFNIIPRTPLFVCRRGGRLSILQWTQSVYFILLDKIGMVNHLQRIDIILLCYDDLMVKGAKPFLFQAELPPPFWSVLFEFSREHARTVRDFGWQRERRMTSNPGKQIWK